MFWVYGVNCGICAVHEPQPTRQTNHNLLRDAQQALGLFKSYAQGCVSESYLLGMDPESV